ncbi:hypothetical protein AB834_05270 [PVC group bacterium (ex Bugula neritina AB1)]|nr:hypothetical protein AB834_05270 [PVC group bacterium (ex Bugula neritina AB1)]
MRRLICLCFSKSFLFFFILGSLIDLQGLDLDASHSSKSFLTSSLEQGRASQIRLSKVSFFQKETSSCAHCQQNFLDAKNLKRHIKVSGHVTHDCFSCGKSFLTSNALLSHKKDNSHSLTLSCGHCAKNFLNQADLKRHLKTLINASYKCQSCAQTFCDEKSFNLHRDTHRESVALVCVHCQKGFLNESNLKDHMKSLHNNSYKCTHCQQMFLSREAFNVHGKLHNNVEKFTCSDCKVVFFKKKDFLDHMSGFAHATYKCGQCQKGFLNNKSLDAHYKTHKNLQKFSCMHCQKSFIFEGQFKNHAKLSGHIHRECGHCGQKFLDQKNLEAHAKSHADLKTFSCVTCQKSFVNQDSFKKHVQKLSHVAHVCSSCNQRFLSEKSLLDHTRSH